MNYSNNHSAIFRSGYLFLLFTFVSIRYLHLYFICYSSDNTIVFAKKSTNSSMFISVFIDVKYSVPSEITISFRILLFHTYRQEFLGKLFIILKIFYKDNSTTL